MALSLEPFDVCLLSPWPNSRPIRPLQPAQHRRRQLLWTTLNVLGAQLTLVDVGATYVVHECIMTLKTNYNQNITD